MLRKSTLFALAVAALGFSAGVPSTAEAGHWHWKKHHHHHWHGHYRYRRPVVVYAARPVVYAAPAVVRAAPRTNCLTKEYTPQGQVLFRDICTNEMALNPPTAIPQETQPAPQTQLAPQTQVR